MSDELGLLASDVEDDLRESVRGLLSTRCAPEAVIAVYDEDHAGVSGLWVSLAAELGLAGLLVPEASGGAGATAREAATVLEEVGRAVAPVPFLTSAVVATSVLAGAVAHDDGMAQQQRDMLSWLAAAEACVALVVPAGACAGDDPASWGSRVRVEDGALHGDVANVVGVADPAGPADTLLVPVRSGDGVELHLVAADAPGVSLTRATSLDMTRPVADVVLSGATSRLVVADQAGADGVRRGLEAGAALLASEQLGVAEACLESTVGYLNQRRQFGRVVGGFQALKHRLADLYVEVESARAVARYAAAALAEDDADLPVAAAMAASYCSEVAVHAAEECVQMHGGIGMTWEHPAHLYLKRAKADQPLLGSPGAHRRRLAGLVDLAPAP